MFSVCLFGYGAPPPGDLENVEARLKYLRKLGDIAWMEKQPPATILIGWKKHPWMTLARLTGLPTATLLNWPKRSGL